MSLIGHSRMNAPSLPFLKDIPFCICVCLVAKWCPTLYNPTDTHGAHQAPLFMGFPSQWYCNGLPFLPPGALPDWGIELVSYIAGRFFTCRASCCILLMLHFIMLFTLMCIRVGIKRIECSTGGGYEFESPNNLDLSKLLFPTWLPPRPEHSYFRAPVVRTECRFKKLRGGFCH